MIQQHPQPSSCSAPFLCLCIRSPQSPAPLRTCASSPPIGSCLDALPNKALAYLQRSHYHLKLQKLEEAKLIFDILSCSMNKATLTLNCVRQTKFFLAQSSALHTLNIKENRKKISQQEQSTTNWLAYHAMSMAYAVRVSRPSCLLMFLAASTTSCVVW